MEGIRRKLQPNPREKANIISILLFWWTKDLFKRGYQKVLELDDCFSPLNVDRSEELGDRLDRNWKKQINRPGHRPSLLKAIFATFWREYGALGLLIAVNDIFIRLAQPFLLGRLLLYFRKDSTMTRDEAFIYAGGIVLMNAVSAIVLNQFFIGGFHNGMKVRIAVCSIIYRKALRLSHTALGDTAPGKVVNLLSNDVNRFDVVSMFIHSMWTAPLMSVIVGVLLWNEVRWAGMIGIAMVFIVVPIQSYTGKLSSIFRLQTALRTDERVRFMDEIISGVQVIKMYAWEKPFARLITIARRLELKIVRKNSYVRALYMTFLLFTTRMALFCTMMSIVLLYGSDQLTASRVFVISAYFNIVAMTMSQMFVRGVAEIAEALVAFKRLQNFMEYEEKDVKQTHLLKLDIHGDSDEKEKLLESESHLPPDIAISIRNALARWRPIVENDTNHISNGGVDAAKESQNKLNGQFTYPNGIPKKIESSPKIDDHTIDEAEEDQYHDWNTPALDNINIDIKKGLLIGVVGPVGAGKSSFLQALLRELPLESGSITISGSISYACQEPWVFASSVRQNILFGQEMEKHRYEQVIRACDLTKDFLQLENSDKTIIGDRGASLSGGQKARINLARAAYRKADIYLLDDPLSAVDAHVGRHLFNECIGPKGYLARDKSTRILVTHQVHFLKEADWILVLRDGKIEIQGSPNDLSNMNIDFVRLLEQDIEDEKNVDEDGGRNRSDSESRQRKSRTNSKSSLRSNFSSKSLISESTEEMNNTTNEDGDNPNEKEKSQSVEQLQQMESSSKGTVHGSVALNYFKAGSNLFISSIILFLFIGTQIFASFADVWVSFWTSQEELRTYAARQINQTINNITKTESITMPPLMEKAISMEYTKLTENVTSETTSDTTSLLSTEACMYVHGGLMVLIFSVGILRSVGFYTLCVRASQKLHDVMFNGVISTTMRFFDTNPSGRILNRFSKDMGATDEFLPKAILDATQIILSMVGAIIVTAVVNPIFLIPIVGIGAVFIYVRRIYLKTSKNIKRLEGVTRSPVFTHLSSTLGGLSTIRAFRAEHILISEFDSHQDIHTSCWYMFISTSSAFGLTLDALCLVFVFFVTFSFLLLEQDVLGDQVGLAITQSMALTGMLQWGIRQSAEVANQLMAVERILEYRNLPPEPQPEQPIAVPDTWPSKGKIDFLNVIYYYVRGAEPVLKSLTFTVNSNEKIGIVGRTGAGKSSLIGSIFRLAHIDGDIFIDGVNTSTISLEKLRSKVSIIPQDPVLFSGTLRRNLDPFEEYPDSSIWRSLEEVELKDIASGPLGLQMPVMAGGSNFSVGQRQLLCLARAILRDNRILILDEATANVDPHTDTLIQLTIRHRFAECTVLTIAHRLHTIMDSDRVLVMDGGKAVEFDKPYILLQNPLGIFKGMVNALGSSEAERLLKISKDKYDSII